MADILYLRGAPAFSAFRLQGLQQRIGAAVPGARLRVAEYWHFAVLRKALADDERAQLAALLEEQPDDAAMSCGELLLVTPRLGTISPWSSKATDIAWNSGLNAIERIERGIAYRVETAQGALSAEQRARLVGLIHDRMTETVLSQFEQTADLFRHFAPQPLASVDLLGGGRAALLSRRGGRLSLS